MESLAKISNNSLKPILCKVEANRHFYQVIDGQLTYQYIIGVEQRKPDQKPNAN
jgi:hypothetical protein